MQCVACTCVLPSRRLPFRLAGGPPGCARARQFAGVPRTGLCLCRSCLWCHIYEIIAKASVKDLFPNVFF